MPTSRQRRAEADAVAVPIGDWWRGLSRDLVWLKVVRDLDHHVRSASGADTLALWARLPPRGEWLRVAWELRGRPVFLPPEQEPHASLVADRAPKRYDTVDLTGPFRRLLDRMRVAGGWLLPLVPPEPSAPANQWLGALGLGWRGRAPVHTPRLDGIGSIAWYLLGQRLEDLYTEALLEALAAMGAPATDEDWRPLVRLLRFWLGGDHWAVYRLQEVEGRARMQVVVEEGEMPGRGAVLVDFVERNPDVVRELALHRAIRQRRMVLVGDAGEERKFLLLAPAGERSLMVIPLGVGRSGRTGILTVYWWQPSGWETGGLSLRPWEALRRIAAEWWQKMDVAHDATRDPLTGVLNRRGMAQAWGETVGKAERGLLGLVDIDLFEEVNDRWGHLMGDEVLRVLAEYLARLAAAEGGWVARWGGDEFVLSLPAEADWEGFGREVGRLLDVHAERQKWPQRITVSGGAAQWRRPRTDFETLLRRADSVLYRAKDRGRARFLLR